MRVQQPRLADWVLVVVTVGLQFWALYAPSLPDLGTSWVPFADKIGHVIVFALATWALLRVLDLRLVMVLMAIQLVVSEVVQGLFLPGRSGDVWDAAADALGIAVGWWTWRTATGEDSDGNTKAGTGPEA
ncbi:MAG: hypothetical protein WAZ15_00535 [Propioniciclava sp.]